jgi:hypothetical protein
MIIVDNTDMVFLILWQLLMQQAISNMESLDNADMIHLFLE